MRFATGCLSLFLLMSCQTTQSHDVRELIEQQYQKLKKAMLDGNAKMIALELYTPDGVLYHGNGEIDRGTEALERSFTDAINSDIVIECRPEEVEVIGRSAFEIGVASIQSKTGNELSATRYMVIWKKRQGMWKMYRDFVQGKNIN